MGKFREHGVLIYLSNPLYLGFVKLQADKGLGRSYAALLPFVEGLYHMGYINEEVYEHHRKKYSVPLVIQKPLSLVHQQQRLKKLEKDFLSVAEQWAHLKPKSKRYWLEKAKEHSDIPNAQILLALEKKESP